MLKLIYIGYSTSPSMHNQWWLMNTAATFDVGVVSFGVCKPTKKQVRMAVQQVLHHRDMFRAIGG